MKYAIGVMVGCLCFFFCSQETLQEAISGCEIEEGTITCLDLETKCKVGFSKWEDPDATDRIKCQCCENKK